MAKGLRKKAKSGRCSPAEHKKRASHRAAEAKWVKKNKDRHRAAAKAYYRKNKAKIKARRKQLKSAAHKAIVARRRAQYGGSKGRPREC